MVIPLICKVVIENGVESEVNDVPKRLEFLRPSVHLTNLYGC